MNLIYSSAGVTDPGHPIQGLTDMANAGLKTLSLDIGMYCSGYDLEKFGKEKPLSCKFLGSFFSICTPEAMMRCLEPFLVECRKRSLCIRMVHLPRLLWDTKRTDLNELLEQIAESAISLCGKAGCPYLIVPPLFSGIEREEEWQVNRSFYLRLAGIARKHRVTLLLTNQCRNYNGHLIRGLCSDSNEAAKWIDRLNAEAANRGERSNTAAAKHSERLNTAAKSNEWLNTETESFVFGFCLDTGICTLCGQDMQEFAENLGNRLQAVILRDCGGQQEASLLPFTAAYQRQPRTDWLSLIRGLRSTGFDGNLLLDFADTAAAFSPLLRPQLLPLARATAEYFKWQINLENLLKKYTSIVLFGAGNMCRNYMKCYGQQYPPLFACDNNPATWGTKFCGLEVRPPDALKELPDSCGIFICNIYYREIETQLKDMGIRNIEFFNDEYMPSFHFDRLEIQWV